MRSRWASKGGGGSRELTDRGAGGAEGSPRFRAADGELPAGVADGEGDGGGATKARPGKRGAARASGSLTAWIWLRLVVVVVVVRACEIWG